MSVIRNFASGFASAHGGSFSNCPPLNHLQASNLAQNVWLDVTDNLYSACLSISDAINGIKSGYPSWSTVKLYYSIFYSLRALLLINNRGVFHLDGKPGLVEIWPGGAFRKLTPAESKGGSHGQVLYLFEKFHSTSAILTPIGTDNSLGWMKRKREEVNYGQQRFLEPSLPDWFANSLGKNTLRSLISTYAYNPLLYAFDPDHAALAFPMLVASTALSEAKQAGIYLPESDKAFLNSITKENAGPLVALVTYLGLN